MNNIQFANQSIETTGTVNGPSPKTDSVSAKPKVGEWYWVTYEEKKPRLYCIVYVGTNYVKIEAPGRREDRIHFKDFSAQCKFEPNPQQHIDKKVTHYKRELDRLTAEIKELTTTLGLSSVALPEGQTAVASLAVRNGDAVNEYKHALVLAKETTLPELFKQIKDTSASLAVWLSASIIPLEAQSESFQPLIKTIESRIFNVELYAGLVETIELITDGKPAAIGEPVHLFQRRAYMDEECLANYECGGMDFDGIPGFDAWLVRPDNRDRILPFQRCLLAFQVRRHVKEREAINISDFIAIHTQEQQDKATFLYMRNGERVYRLQTAIDFGARLFPDLGAAEIGTEKMYAQMYDDRVEKVISAAAYDVMVKHEQEEEARIKQLKKTTPKDDWFKTFGSGWIYKESDKYEEFTPDSVYYDDIEKHVQAQIEAHNRLVIVLQGIMDRSPVFHPHPKFSLWKEEDFSAAFKLVYDDSRALTAGNRPDFEVFRKSLNASLDTGCVTVGQQDFWELAEGARESARLDNDWRTKTHYRPTRFKPCGNPGPGSLATVENYQKRAGKCTFKWDRHRQTYQRNYWDKKPDLIPCSLTVPADKLLNVSAYKPGQFKQFFNDPRTRADYLTWAPYLLAAEEYHAGNKDGIPKKKKK